MSLIFKPHTLTPKPASQAVNTGTDKSVEPPVYTAATNITGQVTPKSAQAMLERFGVDLAKPHLFLCDTDHLASLVVGDRLIGVSPALLAGRIFQIAAPARVHAAGIMGDHVSVALEELDFAS